MNPKKIDINDIVQRLREVKGILPSPTDRDNLKMRGTEGQAYGELRHHVSTALELAESLKSGK